MFQIVNDMKSAPFVPTLYKTFMYSPQSIKKPPIFGKLGEICHPFFVPHGGKLNLQIYSELRKIGTICAPLVGIMWNSCDPRQFLKVLYTLQ